MLSYRRPSGGRGVGVVIQYSVLVVRSGYTRSAVVLWNKGQYV